MATTAIEMTSNGHDVAALRRVLGQFEDEAAAAAWVWNESISQRVDWLIAALEERRG